MYTTTEYDVDTLSQMGFVDPELAKEYLDRTREQLTTWGDKWNAGPSTPIQGDWPLRDKMKALVWGSKEEQAKAHLITDDWELAGLKQPRTGRNTLMDIADAAAPATSKLSTELTQEWNDILKQVPSYLRYWYGMDDMRNTIMIPLSREFGKKLKMTQSQLSGGSRIGQETKLSRLQLEGIQETCKSILGVDRSTPLRIEERWNDFAKSVSQANENKPDEEKIDIPGFEGLIAEACLFMREPWARRQYSSVIDSHTDETEGDQQVRADYESGKRSAELMDKLQRADEKELTGKWAFSADNANGGGRYLWDRGHYKSCITNGKQFSASCNCPRRRTRSVREDPDTSSDSDMSDGTAMNWVGPLDSESKDMNNSDLDESGCAISIGM